MKSNGKLKFFMNKICTYFPFISKKQKNMNCSKYFCEKIGNGSFYSKGLICVSIADILSLFANVSEFQVIDF
jgi:Zn-finger protein